MRRDDRVNGFCGRSGYVFVAALAVVFTIQTAAIYDFLCQCWCWWPVSGFFGALFASLVPLFGSLAGVAAATMAWGWRWYLGALFFFAPLLFILSTALFLRERCRLTAFWRRRTGPADNRMPASPWFDGDGSEAG